MEHKIDNTYKGLGTACTCGNAAFTIAAIKRHIEAQQTRG